ncbi:hypothetical protein OBBRIDRAFT_864233 [Obba rivulosa]|uniref:Uncharacterized protein n=1 Tax=Obba rivulosa TaxID=1052685 RepID=A0A8E2B5Z2_9APHY|nr:hypothetical protein OBBRIDRAFT_864233 [Obba rivulosa]
MPSPTEDMFRQAFRALFDGPMFLPKDDHLGFGLRHQYPADTKSSRFKVCDVLKLKASCATVYRDEEYGCEYGCGGPVDVMCSEIADLRTEQRMEEPLHEHLRSNRRGKLLTCAAGQWSKKIAKPEVKVYWATKTPEVNLMKWTYIAYGNEPALAYAYFHMCLLVKADQAGTRETTGPTTAPTRSSSTRASSSSESDNEDNLDDSGDSAQLSRLLW